MILSKWGVAWETAITMDPQWRQAYYNVRAEIERAIIDNMPKP